MSCRDITPSVVNGGCGCVMVLIDGSRIDRGGTVGNLFTHGLVRSGPFGGVVLR